MFKHILAASAFAVALLLSAQSYAIEFEGQVHGTNTVDHLYRPTSGGGEPVTVTITAEGTGSNKLKVEVQLYLWETDSYLTLREMFVAPGSTVTSSYTIPDDPDHTEIVRYRVSRKIGTQRIDYTILDVSGRLVRPNN